MQVLANVTRAQPAWGGLTEAQRVAADFGVAYAAGASGAGHGGTLRRVELMFARIELAADAPAHAGEVSRPAIWVQYLHN